jgi:hypothetical protein
MTRSINQQVQKAEGSVIMLSLAEKRGEKEALLARGAAGQTLIGKLVPRWPARKCNTEAHASSSADADFSRMPHVCGEKAQHDVREEGRKRIEVYYHVSFPCSRSFILRCFSPSRSGNLPENKQLLFPSW